MLSVSHDISQRKYAEMERRALLARSARRAKKPPKTRRARKTSFLATVSHDFAPTERDTRLGRNVGGRHPRRAVEALAMERSCATRKPRPGW